MMEKFGKSAHTPKLSKGPRKLRNKSRSGVMEHAIDKRRLAEIESSQIMRLDHKLLFYLYILLNTPRQAKYGGPWPLSLCYLRNILDCKCSNIGPHW